MGQVERCTVSPRSQNACSERNGPITAHWAAGTRTPAVIQDKDNEAAKEGTLKKNAVRQKHLIAEETKKTKRKAVEGGCTHVMHGRSRMTIDLSLIHI